MIELSSIIVSTRFYDRLLVETMDDGGMGSLRLFPNGKHKENRKFGDCASEYRFDDIDGVPVLVSLNTDQNGDLFELDVWKTDFSKLKKIP